MYNLSFIINNYLFYLLFQIDKAAGHVWRSLIGCRAVAHPVLVAMGFGTACKTFIIVIMYVVNAYTINHFGFLKLICRYR